MIAVLAASAALAPGSPLAARPRVARSRAVVASEVSSWVPAALAKVTGTLGLTPKDYGAEMGFAGKVQSFEGPGSPNVAWCSGLELPGERGALAVFCGPLTDVPHLVTSCGVSAGGVDLYIDFRPRAESGYDPAYATLADYPAPETREAFAEGSNRKDFAEAFFTDEAAALKAGLLGLPGAEPAPPLSKEAAAALSSGPLLVDIRLPLTEAGTAAGACAAAVDMWLAWMVNAEAMNRGLPAGMRQTATYTRDTKVRAQHFGFLLKKYSAIYGPDGKALAEADAGPLDEAYVGGAS